MTKSSAFKSVLAVVVFFTASAASAQQPKPSLDLLKIGSAFGESDQWQFGIDKSPTVGTFLMREMTRGKYLGGPCRDFVVLAKDGEPMLHLGVYQGYEMPGGAPHTGVRIGVTVGNVGRAVLEESAELLPVLEKYADWKAPPSLQYLRKILTLDYGFGYHGRFEHGPQVKLDIPVGDIWKLISGN